MTEARRGPGTPLTVILPDDVYRQVAHLARLTGRDESQLVVDTLQISLQSVGFSTDHEVPLASLSDAALLALAESQLEPRQDATLSALLEQQQAGLLTVDEVTELRNLMQSYQDALLRKARALHEAVRRGIREPLEA